MSYSGLEKPSNSGYTSQARPTQGSAGRFGFGIFSSARFGITDDYTKAARPSLNDSAVPGEAVPGQAVPGRSGQGYTKTSRPEV